MIVRLTPKYKFVCDRCDKEWFGDEDIPTEVHDVEFREDCHFKHKVKKGQICTDCYTEFWKIANAFFDEVNKERSEDTE